MTQRVEPGTRPGVKGLQQLAPALVPSAAAEKLAAARETTAARDIPSPAKPARNWAAAYSLRLAITDTIVVALAVFGAQFTRFGLTATDVDRIDQSLSVELSYVTLSVVLAVAWVVFLAVFRTRDRRIVGRGSTEYLRIWTATFWLFGFVAIAAFLTTFALARGFILLAFPLGLALLLISRALWRRWLTGRRARGEWSDRVLLLGSLDTVTTTAQGFLRDAGAGYQVVGAIVPGRHRIKHLAGTTIPLDSKIGRVDAVMARMSELGADTLVITSSDELPPQRIRELSWALEPGGQHLVMAPSLTDIGGPRVQVRPVAGMPLVHVETPRYEGSKAFLKRLFDLVGSGLLIVLLGPFMLVVAALIRLSSPGAAIFRQERYGLGGRTFPMLKFRTMVDGADAHFSSLLDQERDAGNDVQFKLKDDPRVTPIGRVLRRFSIDELPQLFNVFSGRMSLVGPRPQVEHEVAQYEKHVHRRFLVKPGMTGLWQVSGRSTLSWNESVRLDLYYVENWSLVGDLGILWRTLRAVVGREGAY